MNEEAYFCLVTWPNGSEGLLFPRPGNVPVCTTLEEGQKDFEIACKHLDEYVPTNPHLQGTVVRLVKFQRMETIQEHGTPQVEKVPPPAEPTCPKCRRTLENGVCEYCANIED